jgi:hypothetical protein
MKKILLQFGVVVTFFAAVCFAQSQTQTQPQTQTQSKPTSLVDVAKKEKQRREKTKPTKTFTNQDIQDFKTKNNLTDEKKEGETEEQAATEDSDADNPTSVENEEAWHQKYQESQDKIKAAEDKINTLQSEINELTRAFYAEADGVAQRPVIEQERNDRLNSLDQAKKELEDAKQAAENLQDEARKAGVPPGWVR